MSKKAIGLIAGVGCLGIIVILVLGGVLLYNFLSVREVVSQPEPTSPPWRSEMPQAPTMVPTRPPVQPRAEAQVTAVPVPTLPAVAGEALPALQEGTLSDLYDQLNPGVVNIQVITQQGAGTGSGFLIDDDGHIVTNNHVVANAVQVVVVFYDDYQATAEVVGTDEDSDLAVIRVDDIPEGAHPLSLGDSSQVRAGEWVIAIGSPFGLGSTMTLGIISTKARTIPSGVTAFSIPEAIQTDAAINPGNSGGPLINLRGEVIGVNAQIANTGTAANAGVGFAIPVNFVRRVAPALIQQGYYEWPWLGVSGGSVNLTIQRANDLASQRGAYIDQVVSDGPAASAGLQGSSGSMQVDGVATPVGGDVIIAIDGLDVVGFDALLGQIADRNPGDTVQLTVVRDGRQSMIRVTLGTRPKNLTQ